MDLNAYPIWNVSSGRVEGDAQQICVTTLALVLYSMPKGSGPYVLERYKDPGID